MLNKKAESIAKEFLSKMNPSLWDGYGAKPENFMEIIAVGFWYDVNEVTGVPMYGICCGDGTWNTSDSYPTHWRELPEEPEVW